MRWDPEGWDPDLILMYMVKYMIYLHPSLPSYLHAFYPPSMPSSLPLFLTLSLSV